MVEQLCACRGPPPVSAASRAAPGPGCNSHEQHWRSFNNGQLLHLFAAQICEGPAPELLAQPEHDLRMRQARDAVPLFKRRKNKFHTSTWFLRIPGCRRLILFGTSCSLALISFCVRRRFVASPHYIMYQCWGKFDQQACCEGRSIYTSGACGLHRRQRLPEGRW